ncbi:cell wall hydrolase [Sphingomonas sp. RT2P30]|uniref:cell wall hydrolase n=1 Tax=Parasphingomonas halimpatiens TaxID=3096162 RepID=UPI002FCA0F5C
MRRLSRVGALAVAFVICAGVSAHAALRAIAARTETVAEAPPVPTGYEALEHFPGAAALYADDPEPVAAAAPAAETAIAGATGSIALPDLPLPPGAGDYAANASIHPAQPFSMKNASAVDKGRALQCLTAAVYYEAATEPDAGQQAVAQVVLNRVRHPAFPATVCGVVYQGSEHSGCQFSFACDGAAARTPSRDYWIRAAKVAAAALGGRVFAPVGLATHYHTYAVTPRWNRSLVMTAAIGAHFFHRWQGWWGTPAAFSQGYAGGEPLPAPHPRADVPVPVLAAIPAPPVVAPRVTAPAAIQPAYAQSGRPLAGGAAVVATSRATASAVPPGYQSDDSQILDKWKDSGKPLR